MKRTPCDNLPDPAALAGRLAASGLSKPAAEEKAGLFHRCLGMLNSMSGPRGEVHALFVPGRIEVLGKHTDYAGGRSLLAAAERGFCVVARARDDNHVRIAPVDQEAVEFAISPDLEPAIGAWSNYPMTVARRLARNFPAFLRGADVAFASDLPPAAGMGSSSALVVASFLVLSGFNDLHKLDEYRDNIASREDLAGYLGTIENGQSFRGLAGDRGVGTFGGSEDHTAMLCCLPDRLVQYAFCPVRRERNIEFPSALSLAIGCSGLRAEKTGSAMEDYNRASALASAALRAWNEATGRGDPSLAAALASDAEAFQRVKETLRSRQLKPFGPAELIGRLEQFHTESNEIIPAAADALARGDMPEFGRVVDLSQELAERLLGNQVPNTIMLARSAKELGAAAASAFGAGFGGAVWAMVAVEESEVFLARWARRYREDFTELAGQSSFFLTRPGPAALSATELAW